MITFDICLLSPYSIDYCTRNFKTDMTCQYFRALLLFGASYNVRLGLFSMKECYIKEDRCIGKAIYWNGTSFAITEGYVPEIVDNYFPPKLWRGLSPDVYAYLTHQILLNGFSLDKEMLQYALVKNGLGLYSIPTQRICSLDDIRSFMKLHRRGLIKPVFSNHGNNIFFVDTVNGELHYSGTKGQGKLDERGFLAICPDSKQRYIIQQRMNFQNSFGQSYDFRLQVSRGHHGDWEPAFICSRTGSSKFVSNVTAGGGINYPFPTLQQEVGNQAEKYVKELEMLSTAVPSMLDKYTREPVSAYGIDVGLDRDSMQLYVIEANIVPGTTLVHWWYAEKRIQYYRHLLGRPDFADDAPTEQP